MQRANPRAIAPEQHEAPAEVDEHEGELASQMLEQRLAMLLIEMDDQLGVRIGPEHMAFGHELGLALGIIEQLAVGDHADIAGLVEDGLLAIGDADDGESAIAHADAGRHEIAHPVRPAMPERRRHPADQGPVGFTRPFEIENARYPAHMSSMETMSPLRRHYVDRLNAQTHDSGV